MGGRRERRAADDVLEEWGETGREMMVRRADGGGQGRGEGKHDGRSKRNRFEGGRGRRRPCKEEERAGSRRGRTQLN